MILREVAGGIAAPKQSQSESPANLHASVEVKTT